MGQLANMAAAIKPAPQGRAEVSYVANDGTQVKLTPAIVMKYVLDGVGGLSDGEIFRIMTKCRARGLNPLAGDVHIGVFKGKANIMVSRDYYRMTASSFPTYDGLEEGVIVADSAGDMQVREGEFMLPGDTLLGGWCDVYDKERSHPARARVMLREYDTKRNLWASKPATMIVKVAEVHALRSAYPQKFAGTYADGEVPEPDFDAEPEAEAEPVRAEVEEVPEQAPAEELNEAADGGTEDEKEE